jgi:hypothetical protein
MYPVFQDIWKEERFPKGWKEGVIVKIPKKGDYRNCNNWRGITLLVIISKVFIRIILDRISGPLETEIRKEQAGFRPNRSCIDQINTKDYNRAVFRVHITTTPVVCRLPESI